MKYFFLLSDSMLKLLRTKRMLLMAFVFAYVGIELSFWSGVYSTCISNTVRIGDNPKSIVALTAICEGLGLFTSKFSDQPKNLQDS